jgi:HK97 family phage major capsid protein
MENLQTLKHKRNKLLTDMQTIASKPWTAESRSKFDRIAKDVESTEEDIQREERLASYDSATAERRDFTRSPRPGVSGSSQDERRSRMNQAFRSYARSGYIEAEYRDLLTTSDVTGGALVPQDFFPELTSALKFYGPIATKVKLRETDNNGAPLKVSLMNDTVNGLVLLPTQGTSVVPEKDPTFQSKLLGVDTVTGGLVKVSFQELNDSSFDLGNLIKESFGMRYGRGIESAITTGKDSAGTVLPNFTSGGLLGAATVGSTTASVASGIGWSDLAALEAALDPAYTITPSWVFNSSTRSFLIGLKDGFGRPYFENDPSESAPFSKIMGFDIVLNQSMPSIAANSTPILFGDLSKSWLHRTDGAPSILRLNERYAD